MGAVTVGLVDDEDVGDLHQPRFHRLDGVARLGDEGDHRRVGELHDVELGLSHPHRLHEHPGEPERVHELEHVARGAGEAAEAAARGHAADEHLGIQGVGLHADAVAQDGAPRERARWIHREHADGGAFRAEMAREAVDEGGLARSRRPGDPEDMGAAQPRLDGAHDLGYFRSAVLDPRDEAGEGEAVAREHSLDEVVRRGGCGGGHPKILADSPSRPGAP